MSWSGPSILQNAMSISRQSVSQVGKETFPNWVSRSVQMVSKAKTVGPNQFSKSHVYVQTRDGNRSDCVRFTPLTRSDRWMSSTDFSETDLGFKKSGQIQVQYDSDAVWGRKIQYRPEVWPRWPTITRSLIVKWEIALF